MAVIIKPPTIVTDEHLAKPSVALLGSIEQGKATDWQKIVSNALNPFDITILNPRREQWDNTWSQTVDNPKFVEQVKWELNMARKANIRLFYFEPATMSSITLLELGLVARVDPLDTVVCCPDGFWRKGNVDIVCEEFGIHTESTLEDAIADIKSRLFMHYNIPRPVIEVKDVPPQPPALEEL